MLFLESGCSCCCQDGELHVLYVCADRTHKPYNPIPTTLKVFYAGVQSGDSGPLGECKSDTCLIDPSHYSFGRLTGVIADSCPSLLSLN